MLPPVPVNPIGYNNLQGTNPALNFPHPNPPGPITNVFPAYSFKDVNGTPADRETTLPYVVMDPGVRNPFNDPNPYVASSTVRLLPTIPLRRLFQLPDKANDTTPPSGSAEYPYLGGEFATGTAGTLNPPATLHVVNQPIEHEQLSPFLPTLQGHSANLFAQTGTILAPGSDVLPLPGTPTTRTINHYLGASLTATATNDQRQHPLYRTEILQKVMNLTTVRTHQFAVWITVGFFEVLNAGTPALGVPDQLGAELGQLAGKNIRYRSFFLLDRTRAVGFNPASPVDFRDVVTYRRRIE